jgi:large subunit ribosomal protein L4
MMIKCTVLDWQGKESGESSIDLKTAKESSAADLLHRAVLRQQAHSRQGTASTLTRSEVRGGGRKPYKQKGTGRARQGSIRTPLRPGGGIIFGPKPRKYNLEMNRKERRLALRTALMSRISDAKIIKDFGSKLEVPKTSEIVALLARLGIDSDGKILVILNKPSEIIKRSIRNLEKVKLISADQLNVFDLLNANSLVIGEDALSTIQEVYSND